MPPIISLHVNSDSHYLGQLKILCDSGSCLNCIKASLIQSYGGDVKPTHENPVGVDGTPLATRGEITLHIEIDKEKKYSGSFVIIENIWHDLILGIPALQELQFRLSKNGSQVQLAEKSISRISPMSSIELKYSPVTFITRNRLNISDETECKPNLREETRICTITRELHRRQAHEAQSIESNPLNTSCLDTEPQLREQSSERQDFMGQNSEDYLGCRRSRESAQVSHADLVDSKSQLNTSANSGATDFNSLHMIANTDLDEIQKSLFLKLLNENEAIFSKNEDDIGKFISTDGGPDKVSFELINPSQVVYSIPRRVPYARRAWLEDKLNQWVKNGLIQEVSPNESRNTIFTSPIIIVPKKNNRYRMAVDYRELNKNLKIATHPLPSVKDAIESLGNKRYFSSLDITSAFNQLELDEKTKRYCGFVTLQKRYIPNRMPFGAHPCPSVFQLFIERALKEVPKDVCTIYLDDILISSKTFAAHMNDLLLVFKELKRHGLKLSPLKCTFFKHQVEYLGFHVGKIGERWGYSPLESKLRPIRELPIPTTSKEVRSFCGSLQYYNSMIPKLNIKLAPLHRGAAKKDFTMTTEMIDSFNEVKNLIEQKIVIAFPDFERKMILSTDASYKGAGAILTQVMDDKSEEIIYLFSKSFNDTQTRWPIVELECLALVWALEKMETLLLGRKFIWRTDSMVLKQMLENPPRDLSRAARKISRYIDFISTYNFTIEHHKGEQTPIRLADYLSRNPICVITRATIPLKVWKSETENDEELQNGLGGWEKFKKNLFEEDGIVYLKRNATKIAVPSSLIQRVIKYYHEQYTVHGGTSRITHLITRLFVWPNMYQSIRQFINNCKECVATKIQRPTVGIRKAIETPSAPWQWIQIDLVSVTSRQASSGYQYILTSICSLTNYVQMEPIESKEAIVVLKALNKIFCNTGLPRIIQSDNGKEFRNQIMSKHAEFLKIEWRFSTPYKPSTNGRIERRHHELSKLLKLLNTNHNNWAEEIPFIVYELNETRDMVTGLTPFEMFHGWQSRKIEVLDSLEYASDDMSFIEWASDLDKSFWEKRFRQRQISMFNRIQEQRHLTKELETLHADVSNQLVPGDLIMVKDVTTTGKLLPKTKGPYIIEKVYSGGSLLAKSTASGKTVRVPAHHAYRFKADSTQKGEDEEGKYVPDSQVPDESKPNHDRILRNREKIDYSKFY